MDINDINDISCGLALKQRAKEELNHQTCGFNVFHRKIAPEIVLLVTRLPWVFGDYKYEGRQVGFHENCTKHGE